MNLEEVKKRAQGKLVLLGFELDRVAGVFSTVEDAVEAVQDSPDRYTRMWWLEFRALGVLHDTCIFERVFLRGRVAATEEFVER